MRPIDNVLNALENVKSRPDGKYTAICPNGHKKRSNSLLINDDSDGKVFIHCFDCKDTHGVLSSIGLEFKDLYPELDPIEQAKQKENYRTTARYNELAFALLVMAASNGAAEHRATVAALIDRIYGTGDSVAVQRGSGLEVGVKLYHSIKLRLSRESWVDGFRLKKTPMLEPFDIESRSARGLAKLIRSIAK